MDDSGSDDAVPAPPVPTDALADWDRTEDSVERLFGVTGTDVRGHTVVYDDADLREAVREATDGAVDQSWRFFFATRLAFRPPLAPGVGTAMVLPSVRAEATRSFVADLESRGVEDVERGRRERTRTDAGERLRLRQVTGVVPLPEWDPVPVEGWVGAWADGDVFVAGGAYPRRSLADVFDGDDERLAGNPAASREELIALVAGVC